jgi:hypothetical protein
MKKFLIILSVTLNIILVPVAWWGYTTSPYTRSGFLKEDVRIGGHFNGKETNIILPKGLIVSDASPRGLDAIDRFEPQRFSITVTSEHELVDYRKVPRSSLYSSTGRDKPSY